nr:hypothetical protein [Acidobacteriota bacterium]
MATPSRTLLLIGLGGLFAGVTGPLLSTFVPLLVRDALGEPRALTSTPNRCSSSRFPRERRGVLASLFLLSMARGGAIGD